MDTKIIAFPKRSAAAPRGKTGAIAAAPVVALDAWQRSARIRRTAYGVFFLTPVLETTGDYA